MHPPPTLLIVATGACVGVGTVDAAPTFLCLQNDGDSYEKAKKDGVFLKSQPPMVSNMAGWVVGKNNCVANLKHVFLRVRESTRACGGRLRTSILTLFSVDMKLINCMRATIKIT